MHPRLRVGQRAEYRVEAVELEGREAFLCESLSDGLGELLWLVLDWGAESLADTYLVLAEALRATLLDP